MKLAVSILSSNYDELESIKRINDTKAEYLHVDVMDGKFVKEKSQKYEHLHESTKPLEVHLMVSNPFNHISKYSLLNTDSIILSLEIDEDLSSLIDYIKSMGIKAGLAVKPETNLKKLEPYIDKLDVVLLLTVNPGQGGQKMIESSLYKIDLLKQMRKEKSLSFEIVIDGGVNDETINKITGCDIAVCGSYICKSEDFKEQIEKLGL